MTHAGEVSQERDNLDNLWDTSCYASSSKPSTSHGIGVVDRGIGFASLRFTRLQKAISEQSKY